MIVSSVTPVSCRQQSIFSLTVVPGWSFSMASRKPLTLYLLKLGVSYEAAVRLYSNSMSSRDKPRAASRRNAIVPVLSAPAAQCTYTG